MRTKRSGRSGVLTLFAIFIAAVVGILGLGSAKVYAAPGNNGDIKVSEVGGNQIPENNPHVPCTFNLEWWNYDEAELTSTVKFEAWSPTADSTITVTGNTTPTFTGGQGLNHRETYTLAFTGDPQAKQGYHVKVTATTPKSNGNETKTKEFWAGPCDGSTTTEPPTTTITAPPTETTEPPTETTEPPTETTEPSASSTSKTEPPAGTGSTPATPSTVQTDGGPLKQGSAGALALGLGALLLLGGSGAAYLVVRNGRGRY